MKTGELFTIYGQTSGAQSGYTMCLASEHWSGYVNTIRIPKGMKMKFWEVRLCGDPARVDLELELTSAAAFNAIDTFSYGVSGSDGVVISREGRPTVVASPTGTRWIQFEYNQPVSSKTYMSCNVEIADE